MADTPPPKAFNYAALGLPGNEKWEKAARFHAAALVAGNLAAPVETHMQNWPGAAARMLLQHCEACSEESVTFVLLGPRRNCAEKDLAPAFGERAAALARAIYGEADPVDEKMARDAERIAAVNAIMTAQKIAFADASDATRRVFAGNVRQNFYADFPGAPEKEPALCKILDATLAAAQPAAALSRHGPGN